MAVIVKQLFTDIDVCVYVCLCAHMYQARLQSKVTVLEYAYVLSACVSIMLLVFMYLHRYHFCVQNYGF